MSTATATLHLKSRDPKSVYRLSVRVFRILYANKAVFPVPDPAEDEFRKELEQLNALIESNKDSAMMREMALQQAAVVMNNLKRAQTYVNQMAKGDKIIILSSGFDCSHERVGTTYPPAKAVIRRVADGSSACSMKIYAESLERAPWFKIEICDNLAQPEWVMVDNCATFYKIELKNLIRGKEIFVRISGGNICGWGDPSDPVSFIPR